MNTGALQAFALVMAAVTGCATTTTGETGQAGPSSELVATRATIENTLPADGCSFVIKIGGRDYAPDAETLAAIRQREVPFGTTEVAGRYRVTGRTAKVECGFGRQSELPEVAMEFDKP